MGTLSQSLFLLLFQLQILHYFIITVSQALNWNWKANSMMESINWFRKNHSHAHNFLGIVRNKPISQMVNYWFSGWHVRAWPHFICDEPTTRMEFLLHDSRIKILSFLFYLLFCESLDFKVINIAIMKLRVVTPNQ